MSNIVAQRIVDNIAEFNFTMDGVETKITISGGMSEYPTHSNNTKDLIELADQAMYRTKQEGGNGIITHISSDKDND
jgi:diguanylate cyclase (GGDEF)-like protein